MAFRAAGVTVFGMAHAIDARVSSPRGTFPGDHLPATGPRDGGARILAARKRLAQQKV